MSEPKQAENAWRVLAVLLLANLFNFFDRAIPAILLEPIRQEWDLSDFELGVVSTAFVVVFAIAALPLGRLSDTTSRKKIMGWGLIVWSAFTALAGASWSFGSFLLTRIGVGIGEASYGPAAIPMIGDLFPANKRSRAIGLFVLGLPLGLILAYATVGGMARAFDSWRAPFVIAMVPGLLIAVLVFMIREPLRGAAEAVVPSQEKVAKPIRKVLAIPTMLWLLVAGTAANFAAYAANSFMVPLLQRYFGLPLETAAVATGVIVGVTGLVGLTLGGWAADRMHQRSERGRLLMGGLCLGGSAAATMYALSLDAGAASQFVTIFAFGWLLQYVFYVTALPAIQDVVEPRLRATAMAVYFAAINLLGGAFGPVVVGFLSDLSARDAMVEAGAAEITDQFRAVGLHDAMLLVPVTLLVTAIAVLLAARTFPADAGAMQSGIAGKTTQPSAA